MAIWLILFAASIGIILAVIGAILAQRLKLDIERLMEGERIGTIVVIEEKTGISFKLAVTGLPELHDTGELAAKDAVAAAKPVGGPANTGQKNEEPLSKRPIQAVAPPRLKPLSRRLGRDNVVAGGGAPRTGSPRILSRIMQHN